MKLTIFFLFIFFCSSGHTKLLQIIHTNDLHSYFNGPRDGTGGYAKLKTKIELIRKKAFKNNIDVLQVDAGDFGEGTSFFLSNDGSDSLVALEKLGIEVSVIGNHDYMLGGDVLSSQINRANISTKFLSANLVSTPEMNIGETIKPFFDITKNGISIRVIGLTTAAPHFEYPLKPGHIAPYLKIANDQANIAKEERKELVIALTHLGLGEDKQLASNSKNIDLIIGGHSHSALKKEKIIYNKNKIPVPIVQAGSNSRYVGSLLIDVVPGKPVTVVDYKLIPIDDSIIENEGVKDFVNSAYENLSQYFNRDIDEVIGYSDIDLSGFINGVMVLKPSCWGKHMAKMQKEAIDSDIGLHMANFEGDLIPAGPIRFIDMIDNFPHLTKYGDNGWQIAKFSLHGRYLKWLMIALANTSLTVGLNFHGITFKKWKIPHRIPFIGGKTLVWKLRVNGKRIRRSKKYSFALPLEVAHTLRSLIPKKLQGKIPYFHHSGVYYWDVMERYIKENSPISCI
ncbi:MAG: 5'-nucleotidase [Bacteriovoracaceae bacterium]|jgi:2',3'-cyclic-nucleotide 2'-phosphodiesterase (5'-nucleotidase family)